MLLCKNTFFKIPVDSGFFVQMLEWLPSGFSGLNVEQRFVHFTGVGVQDTEKKRKGCYDRDLSVWLVGSPTSVTFRTSCFSSD